MIQFAFCLNVYRQPLLCFLDLTKDCFISFMLAPHPTIKDILFRKNLNWFVKSDLDFTSSATSDRASWHCILLITSPRFAVKNWFSYVKLKYMNSCSPFLWFRSVQSHLWIFNRTEIDQRFLRTDRYWSEVSPRRTQRLIRGFSRRTQRLIRGFLRQTEAYQRFLRTDRDWSEISPGRTQRLITGFSRRTQRLIRGFSRRTEACQRFLKTTRDWSEVSQDDQRDWSEASLKTHRDWSEAEKEPWDSSKSFHQIFAIAPNWLL